MPDLLKNKHSTILIPMMCLDVLRILDGSQVNMFSYLLYSHFKSLQFLNFLPYFACLHWCESSPYKIWHWVSLDSRAFWGMLAEGTPILLCTAKGWPKVGAYKMSCNYFLIHRTYLCGIWTTFKWRD
jgi:hypothetical protein